MMGFKSPLTLTPLFFQSNHFDFFLDSVISMLLLSDDIRVLDSMS